MTKIFVNGEEAETLHLHVTKNTLSIDATTKSGKEIKTGYFKEEEKVFNK